MGKAKILKKKISWQKGLCECNTAMKCLSREFLLKIQNYVCCCNRSHKCKRIQATTCQGLRQIAEGEARLWDSLENSLPWLRVSMVPEGQRYHMSYSVGAPPCHALYDGEEAC